MNPFGIPYGNPGRVQQSSPASPKDPYGTTSRGAYDNSRQSAKAAPGWQAFAGNREQRDRADVSNMKGFKKTAAASNDKDKDLKEEVDQKVDDLKDETADAATQEGSDVAETVAGESEDAKSAEERIIEEAEAVVDNAAKATGAVAEDDVAAAKQEAADWQDRYMRLHAEWDTYRRRMTEQRAEEKARATEKLMEDLLPVLDDFERTVDYANENGEAGLLDGVKAVQTKLIDALKKDGLEVIDPVDEPYNALEAQAVATVPDDEMYDETVKDVYQKGYKLGNKVIRPAMVTVTTGGPARPKDEEDNDKADEE